MLFVMFEKEMIFMKSIHLISEKGFSILSAKAERINKKAKRTVVYLSIVGDGWKAVNGIAVHKLEVLLYVPLGFGESEAKADILAIKYRDYADEAAPVIVHAVEDGVELDKTWFSDDFSCHHCGTHRNRKIAYIVRMKRTKKVVQVGRACLTDVLGVAPERFMTLLKYFEDFEDELLADEKDDESDSDFHEYHAPSWYSVDDFLGVAVHVTTREGRYVRTKDDYGDRNPNSTFEMVSREIVNADSLTKEERRTADYVKAWYLSLDKKDEFGLNVQNILKKEFCSKANAALLAFLPNAYNKHLAYEAEKKRKEELASRLSNEFVGEVGKRLRNIPVQLVGCHTFMVQGHTYYEQENGGKEMAFYDFVDADGNILSWKTDKFAYAKGLSYDDKFSCLCEFFDDRGNVVEDAPTIVLSGTVKEFNEYKGKKKTILTRCRWTPQVVSAE